MIDRSNLPENPPGRGESEAERHNLDLAALSNAISVVSASLELPEIIANLKSQLSEQFQIPGGVIFLYDEAEDLLHLEVAWGIPPTILSDFKRFPPGAYHYKRVIQARQPLALPDFRQATSYIASGLESARPNWRSYLCFLLQFKDEVLGLVDLFSTAASFTPSQVALFTTLGKQVGTVIQNARLFAEVRDSRQRLQMLSQQLLEVQERERRSISRELHDQIGQALTAVKVNLQAVLRLSGASTNSRYLEESIGIIERTLQQVRDLSLHLRPPLLDDLGIVAALRWYVDRQGQRAGFHTEFTAHPPDLRLPADMETVCFRLVQEALTNIIRHAGASEVQVRLVLAGSRLELVIRDNGVGFDVNEARQTREPAGASLGLMGMYERVQLLGGQFEIKSGPRRGTEIRAIFTVPGSPAGQEASHAS